MSFGPYWRNRRKGIKKGLIFHFLLKKAVSGYILALVRFFIALNTQICALFLQKIHRFCLILHNWSLSYVTNAKTGQEGCVWCEKLDFSRKWEKLPLLFKGRYPGDTIS